MSYPSNIELPNWVKWVAQDENGSWWGFSVEPLEHFSGWYENEVGDFILLLKPQGKTTIIQWRDTLTKVNN